MTPLDYEFLRKLLKERSGLDLSADKQYLVESRLIPLARKASLPGLGELVAKLKTGAEPLSADVVEAMTTNETFFFRDKVPFDHLKATVLPEMAVGWNAPARWSIERPSVQASCRHAASYARSRFSWTS